MSDNLAFLFSGHPAAAALSRRRMLQWGASSLALPAMAWAQGPAANPAPAASAASAAWASAQMPAALAQALAQIEARYLGRLGLSACHLPSGERVGWRETERFEPCSTYKGLLAAWLLREHELGRPWPGLKVPAVLSSGHAPFCQAHAGQVVPALRLAQAMTEESDNEAARLVLTHAGGTGELEAFVRSLGHARFTFPADPHIDEHQDPAGVHADPLGMQTAMARVATGPVLSAAGRRRWLGWLKQAKTGQRRLRAGWPRHWVVGDKTGSGEGQSHDLALVMRPGAAGQPVFSVAAFWHNHGPASSWPAHDFERREGALRETAKALQGWMQARERW